MPKVSAEMKQYQSIPEINAFLNKDGSNNLKETIEANYKCVKREINRFDRKRNKKDKRRSFSLPSYKRMKRNIFMSFKSYISLSAIPPSSGDTLQTCLVGMKEVVTGGEFYLVVQGVGCRETVENSAIGHVNVGKGGELETVAHQFLGDTCCGKCGMAID